MSGWRYELGGKALLEFLDGDLSLSMDNMQLQLTRSD